jgi:hypothetical protein
MKWQRIGAAFSEMEFAELKRMSRADICAGFGTPGPVINYLDESHYNVYESALKAFYITTMLPRAARLAEEWELAVLRPYEGDRSLSMSRGRTAPLDIRRQRSHGYQAARRAATRSNRRWFAWFDSSGIYAVQLAALSVTDQAHKWWTMGTPLNHLYQAFDVPFPDVDWGDTGYLPIGLQPAGVDVLDTIDDEDGSVPEPGLLPEADQDRTTPRHKLTAEQRTSEATKTRLHALWRKSWEPLENSMDKAVRSHFFGLRKETLANLDRVKDQLPRPPEGGDTGRKLPGERRDLVGSILFDIVKANGRLTAKVGPLLREATRLGGQQSMDEAAAAQGADTSGAFNLADPQTAEKLRQRLPKLGGVNDTLRRRIARELAAGLDAGESA